MSRSRSARLSVAMASSMSRPRSRWLLTLMISSPTRSRPSLQEEEEKPRYDKQNWKNLGPNFYRTLPLGGAGELILTRNVDKYPSFLGKLCPGLGLSSICRQSEFGGIDRLRANGHPVKRGEEMKVRE